MDLEWRVVSFIECGDRFVKCGGLETDVPLARRGGEKSVGKVVVKSAGKTLEFFKDSFQSDFAAFFG